MRCVPAHHFTVAKARTWRSAIDEDPPYQRASAVWSLDKQQLFIDSLLNGYDVPKIYLHDLRGEQPTKVYAIVDGKQRLTTLWRFLDDAFPLAADFRIEPGHLPDLPAGAVAPVGAVRFSQLDPHWQRVLTGTYLSVVLIRDASEEDIEDLFSRLNNGEALTAPERRNALGGDMVRLIREVARRPFLTECLPFADARLEHHELAAQVLVLEFATTADPGRMPDLGDAALDRFVRAYRQMPAEDRAALIDAVGVRLDLLARICSRPDARLGTPARVLASYLFVRSALDRDPSDADVSRARRVLDALDRPEADSGVGAPPEIERRLAVLRAAFAARGDERG